jgi:CheY-like chemotaxis protein
LHQIIINLMSNAVKFTSNGKISVNVRLQEEDEDSVTIEFTVADTGIGILPDKIDTVFENFQQATSGTSRIYGGTGLGLAIVKQLVEAQGGTIFVKSKPDEGSSFSFTLSFQKTNQTADTEAEIAETRQEFKNIKVLLVEDNHLNQLLMKTLLDDFGFERDVADNGIIAIDKLKSKTFDIVLMDLQMPEMNGFETTEYIRNKMNSNIPIIALTADVTTVDLEKCNAAGMNDYLAKPIDEKLLYNKIIGLVKKPRNDNVGRTKGKKKSENKKSGCIDMTYLAEHTNSNPKLMMEMISLYLVQTPPLVTVMRQCLEEEDWDKLYAAVHKMIPSFSIMGINAAYETMAKKVQDITRTKTGTAELPGLILQLSTVCDEACRELKIEFNKLKNLNV